MPIQLKNNSDSSRKVFKIILYTIYKGRKISLEDIRIRVEEKNKEQYINKTYIHTSDSQGKCIIPNIDLNRYNTKIT